MKPKINLRKGLDKCRGVKSYSEFMQFLNFVLEGIMDNQKKGNAFSITALVCGILGVIGAFIPFVTYVAWLIGILGIVFGALGMKRSKETNTGFGLAVAGLVLGIIGAVIGSIGFIFLVILAALVTSA